MKKTDDQLISDYLEGNEKALSFLIDRYLSDAYNFAVKLTGDAQVAEDITQESFTKAWKNMQKFVPGNSFRGWLFSIVKNTAIDWLRKKKEIPFSAFATNTDNENVLEATLADSSPLPDELLAQAQDARYLEELLLQINPQYQEVLTLRHTSSMTFEEIGKVLKRPLHTVKSQHRRGLVAMRRLIEARTA
ncbi:MAG TPA: RNA polymerase sigma factor [Candidatus Paceibacterota bacterium]|nr:RNA polymerase sigma factor [Candidatus Paceibacterota bacterium]